MVEFRVHAHLLDTDPRENLLAPCQPPGLVDNLELLSTNGLVGLATKRTQQTTSRRTRHLDLLGNLGNTDPTFRLCEHVLHPILLLVVDVLPLAPASGTTPSLPFRVNPTAKLGTQLPHRRSSPALV